MINGSMSKQCVSVNNFELDVWSNSSALICNEVGIIIAIVWPVTTFVVWFIILIVVLCKIR